jgi:hypothetical protein
MSNNTFEDAKHVNAPNQKEFQLKTPLHPFDLPSQPWEAITLDLISTLPESQGHNAILTIVDWLTKAVKFKLTHIELNSPGFM